MPEEEDKRCFHEQPGIRSFEELGDYGCKYGWLWVQANEAAVTVAGRYGLTPYKRQNKAAIMAIVLAVIESLNKRGVIKLEARSVKDYIIQSPAFLEKEMKHEDGTGHVGEPGRAD